MDLFNTLWLLDTRIFVQRNINKNNNSIRKWYSPKSNLGCAWSQYNRKPVAQTTTMMDRLDSCSRQQQTKT
jgi:hypothetical protein